MNLSGVSVACLVNRHGVSLGDLLIVYDDIDLPAGRIRLRKSGSSGGHKGMNSIIAALGSDAFSRMRVGIGRPDGVDQTMSEDPVINYVLSDFSRQEEAIIKAVIAKVAEAIDFLISEGVEAAMGKFN
jgi:PTH1 family peptidyl-tRNA hydrolase